jgi:hypothetical protein
MRKEMQQSGAPQTTLVAVSVEVETILHEFLVVFSNYWVIYLKEPFYCAFKCYAVNKQMGFTLLEFCAIQDGPK